MNKDSEHYTMMTVTSMVEICKERILWKKTSRSSGGLAVLG